MAKPAIVSAALAFLPVLHASASAASIHIVAFGDSATAGYLVPRARTYPAQLQAALRKKGYDVDVANAGINGDTTTGALARFDNAIGPDTDIAIVEFGVNDLRRGATMAIVRAQMTEIVRTLRARGIQVLVIGLGRLDLSNVASTNGALYEQWNLPRGKYRASDGQHFNAEGYAVVVARMLPQVEAMIARISPK
jgi:acyl-CoA thioesterase I